MLLELTDPGWPGCSTCWTAPAPSGAPPGGRPAGHRPGRGGAISDRPAPTPASSDAHTLCGPASCPRRLAAGSTPRRRRWPCAAQDGGGGARPRRCGGAAKRAGAGHRASHLAVPIACALASSGVGHVDPDVSGITRVADAVPAGLLPSDAHRPRGVAAADAVRRAAPDVDLGSAAARPGDLRRTRGLRRTGEPDRAVLRHRRLAHLAVTVRDGTVVVGPLVRPGRHALPATASTCTGSTATRTGRCSPPSCTATPDPRAGRRDDRARRRRVRGRGGARRTSTAAAPETLGATVEIAGPARRAAAGGVTPAL